MVGVNYRPALIIADEKHIIFFLSLVIHINSSYSRQHIQDGQGPELPIYMVVDMKETSRFPGKNDTALKIQRLPRILNEKSNMKSPDC